MSASTRLGLCFAVTANVIWGLFPIFWQLLQGIPAVELVAHRIVWAFVFAGAIAAIRFRLSSLAARANFKDALRSGKTWATYATAAVLIAINWGAFLYAVTHEQVLLSSLGYYINPLFNVLLGVVVLREKLSAARWGAVALAAVGVTVMTIALGTVPWVSLMMATSFAGYALVKKKAKLDALNGLFLETLILLPPTLIYLAFLQQSGNGSFTFGDPWRAGLLILGGLFTLVPLAFFSAAAQRIPLTLVGILQYVGPTLQFIVGAFYFGEPLSTFTLIGFAFVWSGVAVFMFSRR